MYKRQSQDYEDALSDYSGNTYKATEDVYKRQAYYPIRIITEQWNIQKLIIVCTER